MRSRKLLSASLFSSTLAGVLADTESRCLALKDSLHLENTTILEVSYIAAPTNVSAAGSCQSSAPVTYAPLCRVYFVVNTTEASAVHAEAWLPDTWYGRFLGLGNGGYHGCIDYIDLDYGTSLHFASVSSDNGLDTPFSARPFLNHPEVINDFASRAVHVEALIGKQIVSAYYGVSPESKIPSYFLGCSTGGRQGTQAALKYPEDFDGILAGAPGTDFNHLIGWQGMLSRFVGATVPPDLNLNPVANDTSPKYLPRELWGAVSEEILRQCDGLDGIVDGIIADPDECDFDPSVLRCTEERATDCLTAPRERALRNIYSPLYGLDGELMFPRYAPGAEADPAAVNIFGGSFWILASEWEKYAILNVTEHDFTHFGLKDIALWDKINPGGIATWDGNLMEFRDRGGKFLTYHGTRDQLISPTQSKRFYSLLSSTLNQSSSSLDDFYRLFFIPGMAHCAGGLGQSSIGQGTHEGTNLVNDSSHNALLALVDWVEGGKAPEVIIGVDGEGKERVHCKWPERSRFDGAAFVCV
ncbi:carboxylic ester hydrolase [Favolaschia claudopus]|uniref:Carboxylic ester hydrolase n=1 Tax=Favolaschia claudopus TaxID=2862362 RepID=A0AAW0DGJ7_9AGAR